MEKYRINLKVAVLCIIAAATFWFFKAMNQRYVYTFGVPVVFSYDQQNEQLIDPSPSSIKINAEGYGWNLMLKRFGIGCDPVQINLSKKLTPLVIRPQDYESKLVDYLGAVSLNRFVDDTLYTGVDRLKEVVFAPEIKIEVDTAHWSYRLISVDPKQLKILLPSSKTGAFLPPQYTCEVASKSGIQKVSLPLESFPGQKVDSLRLIVELFPLVVDTTKGELDHY